MKITKLVGGVYLVFSCLFLASCKEEVIPVPLSEDKMVTIMIDLHIAEAMLEKLIKTDQDTVGKVYYRMIFREHGVTEEEFNQTISVLREDPKRLNQVYERVLEELNVMEATAKGVQKME